MKKPIYTLFLVIVLILAGIWYYETDSDQKVSAKQMSFFVTSSNPGKGGDLGGLSGADAFCQSLADSVDAGDREWKAYLSTDTENARDRIGKGPWINAKGIVVANNLEELHSEKNNITKETALTEKGEPVNGRGDTPNLHDILTGSGMDGMKISGSLDTTCHNWTSSAATSTEGSAMVGHHDRIGLRDDVPAKSWNSSHLSRGCSLEALASSGGGGLFYCFAQ